jgi:hypothetical protein
MPSENYTARSGEDSDFCPNIEMSDMEDDILGNTCDAETAQSSQPSKFGKGGKKTKEKD